MARVLRTQSGVPEGLLALHAHQSFSQCNLVQETNLADLAADAVLQYANTSTGLLQAGEGAAQPAVVLLNAGVFRAGIAKGNVTQGGRAGGLPGAACPTPICLPSASMAWCASRPGFTACCSCVGSHSGDPP